MLAANRTPIRTADREQALYFNEVLSGWRTELERQLDALHVQAMELTRIGDQARLQGKRRIIRALENEAHSVDRMLKALRNRLGSDIRG